jgi:hypothetical protein
MNNLLPAWLQYLQALAVLLIPLIGAWIAWQQVHIARVKLQHDLYERRYAVFDAARKLLAEVVAHRTAPEGALRTYTIATADAVFLFNDQIAEYLKELRKRAIILETINSIMEPLPPGDKKVELWEKASKEFLWLNAELDALVGRFKPFLTLERSKRLGWPQAWRTQK